MDHIVNVRERIGAGAERFYKTNLFASQRLLLGLNCLEPGQSQSAHEHDGQDKFYFVVDGVGHFQLGDQSTVAGPGSAVWAPAGLSHGVSNGGQQRLVLLVGIAPAPSR